MFYLFSNNKYLDLKPFQAGYAQNKPSGFFGPATRNHYLFHYVISGAGTLISNDSSGKEYTFKIHSGQGFLIFPAQLTTYIADRDHPWEYVWIEFDGILAEDIIRNSGLSILSPVYRSSDKVLTNTMLDAMLEMAKPDKETPYYNSGPGDANSPSFIRNTSETPFYKMSKLYQFADCLIRSSAASTRLQSSSSMSDYYLQTIFTYIDHNFMNPISVESLAELCNIHRNQLLKIFKDNLGKGPQAYLIEYRMSKAAQLLSTTKLSIGEISSAVGYPNQLHFSRSFKNVYGISPKQYRDQAAKNSVT